jgi:adenosylhomocysteine nucleosidase
MIRYLSYCLLFWVVVSGSIAEAKVLDPTPRTVVMTAFPPEWDALVMAVKRPKTYRVNGLTLLTGTLEGRPVLLVQSGVSMVNAAMNTQVVLDRFTVRRIIFSGIAGGVDPSLSIGDVVVPEHWAPYLEVSFARKTEIGWVTPEPRDPTAPANFGMMFPRGVRVGNGTEEPRRRYDFPADPALLTLARALVPKLSLNRCIESTGGAASRCLGHVPKIVVGGTGVSAGVFADNAEYRDYLFDAWKAVVVDMESAAVAQVAYANRVPIIVFRSLSDLAGGDAGQNQLTTFMTLAAGNSAEVVRAFVAALPD